MMHANVDLIQAAKSALFILETPLVDSRFDASARAEALRKAIEAFEKIEAPKPRKGRAKLAPQPEPDEESPYAPARFLPLARYSSKMKLWERVACEVTFADGVKVRAYAMRDPKAKALDIGRPARAAVEKYRFRMPIGERCRTETIREREYRYTETVYYSGAVPEIVEVRDTEAGDIFDVALANRGTADIREARQ
jgi:hypothetical protein